MYLIDTNVWLERLLDQEKSEETGRFLGQVPSEQLFLTDFSLHSIGIVLTRLKRMEVLTQFIQDAFIEGSAVLVNLDPKDIQRLVEIMKQFDLDFDDAYQYTSAEKHNLILVSFDADFDRTKRGRKVPESVLKR